MKNVKMFITAVAILATVSGALAFKAAKYNGTLYCGADSGSTTECTGGTIYSPGSGTGSSLKYCHAVGDGSGGTCATTTTRVVVDPK